MLQLASSLILLRHVCDRVLMGRRCGLRLFRTWALHDKRERYEEHHEQAKHTECGNEPQHVRLQVDRRRQLCQGTVRGLSGAGAHRGEVLCHRVQLPLEEWIGMLW